MVKEKEFIPALTGIRAISAYFIFFYHLNYFSPQNNSDAYLVLNQFYTFTTFFFVLSGLIICHKYYEISSLEWKTLYNYFVNRISRIFPILFILISITFLLQYIKHLDTPDNILKSYFYNVSLLKGFSTEYKLTGIGPSWSMSVEELFYVLSPLIFSLTLKVSTLLKYVLLMYCVGALLTFIFSNLNADGFFGDYKFTYYFTFFGRAFEFACGIFLALIIKGKLKPGLLGKAGKGSLYIGIALVILSVSALYFIARYYDLLHAQHTWAGLFVNNTILPIGIIFLFYGLIYHKSLLQRFLGSWVMVALGSATYSFYLLHTTFVLSWIQKYISHNLLVTFISMVLFSYCFYKLVEQPIARLLRKRLIIKQIN